MNRHTVSLTILCLTGFLTTVDRLAFPVLLEPIKHEFALSDTQIGLLTGIAFTLMYALAAIPVARWADVGDRRLIIALSMGIWSVMTAACGLAQSAVQLFAARFGVGFGDAGSAAPAQSLIADWYPPERRAFPLSLFVLGMTLGGAAGYVLVGILADQFGWRLTLVILGLPGVLLSALIYALVKEPRSLLAPAKRESAHVDFREVLAGLMRKRALIHIAIGYSFSGFASYGIFTWLPSFFIRTHGTSLTQFGLWMGLVTAIAGGVGLLLGGWLGNRLLARDLRWGLWLPAIGSCLYAFSLLCALLAPSVVLAFACYAMGTVAIGLGAPLIMTIVNGLAGPTARAVSLAMMGLLAVLIGGGLGPLAVGALSDALQNRFAAESLRYSIMLMTPLLVWIAAHYWLASRHVLAEFEDPIPTGQQ